MLRDRDRPFTPESACGAILSGCPDRVPAWAFCPMISTFRSGALASHRSAGEARPVEAWTVTDDWPDPVPITDAEFDVFEAWFGDLFDELFGPCR